MSFRKDIISIQLTTFLNVLAGFIYFPILAKVFKFPPDAFGQFQYINSITMIVMSFALLSLDIAFISESEDQGEKETAIAFSTMVLLGVSFFGLTTLVLFISNALNILNFDQHFIFYIFLSGIFLVFERAYYALFREKKEFSHVAKARVIITISHPIIGCFLAFLFRSVYVLLMAFAVSHLFGAYYYHQIAKRKGIMPRWILDIGASKQFVVKNWNTIIFQTPSGFLNTFYHNLPVLLIRSIFSSNILGFYSLSMRVLGTTNRLLSQGLYETFLPYVAKSETNREYALRYFPVICAVFFPAFFAASVFSPWYVQLLFGDSFLFVSKIIKIMGPFYFTQAVVGPFIGYILIYRRSELNLAVNLGGVILRTGLFFLGNMIFGLSGALYSISIAGVIVYQVFLVIAASLSNHSIRKVCFSLFPYQIMLFTLSLDLIPFWYTILFLVPSFYVGFRNKNFLLGKGIKNNIIKNSF